VLELFVALVLPAAIGLPHALPLHRVAPATAASVWLLALVLRAVVAIGGALFFFVYLPQSDVFRAVADWCLHEVLPLLALHLGFSGHPLAHAAAILPGLALALSLVWVLFGIARAWLALRRLLARALGDGPLGCTVVADERILVAVTGLGEGRILVSDRALGEMDFAELEASVAHELGHIERRHRPVLLLASLLAALARPLPGTRRARLELAFNLERDADAYAVRRTRDPLALASAICKAAVDTASPTLAALGGSGRTTLRVEYLLDGTPHKTRLEPAARALAALLAVLALGLAVTVPAWGLATPGPVGVGGEADVCHHA
jgi:hypothetical protein